jgi:hypothetical protein
MKIKSVETNVLNDGRVSIKITSEGFKTETNIYYATMGINNELEIEIYDQEMEII